MQIPDGPVGTGEDNKDRKLSVSDVVDTSNNQNILFGAQFTDYIRMTFKGVAISGGTPADPLPCPTKATRPGRAANAAALTAEPEDEKACDALETPPLASRRW